MFALHLSLAALSWRWLLLFHELFRVRKGTVFVVLALFPGSLCSRSAKHLNIDRSHILFMEVEFSTRDALREAVVTVLEESGPSAFATSWMKFIPVGWTKPSL